VAAKKPKRQPKTRNAVGAALKAAREAKGMTQAAVAAKLQLYGWDIDRTSYVRIESGERVVSDCEMIALADVLGISSDVLTSKANRATVRRILRTLDR
jgi:transcriptional regulator with XRE-family HTH domain